MSTGRDDRKLKQAHETLSYCSHRHSPQSNDVHHVQRNKTHREDFARAIETAGRSGGRAFQAQRTVSARALRQEPWACWRDRGSVAGAERAGEGLVEGQFRKEGKGQIFWVLWEESLIP